ncbi:MAG: hypothetical protein RQ729_08775 [Wenzhouxiangellaceae bacterium]|nr:hypothetical protein [Wenzhouxiangellaceae bacterium]
MKRVLAIMVSILFSMPALSQDVEEAASDPKNIFPDAAEIGGSEILALRDNYLNQRGWSLGFSSSNPNGAYIGWGSASIQINPESVTYGRARIAAIDAAILQAIGEFTLSLGRETVTETISEIMQDPNALQNAKEASISQYYEAVESRLKNLTVAQLDALLENLGVDSSEHVQLNFAKKVDLARESVSKQIIRTAAEQFNGIRVISTFEEKNQVGALVIYHPKLRQFAQDVLNGTFVTKGTEFSESAIEQAIGGLSSEELIFVHGLRVLKDSDGNRVIIAFGQASPEITRMDSAMKQRMAINAAQREADLRADGFISEFLDSFVEVNEQQLTESVARISTEVSGNRTRETESTEFGNSLRSLIRQSSASDLSGVVTVKNWRANHPDTGHLYAGSIKMWSPTTDAAFTGRLQQKAATEAEFTDNVDVSARQSSDVGNEDW